MASTINASTSGVGGVITTADATGVLDLQTADVTRASVSSSGLKISRVDSSNEGGQLDLCRSSDNTSAWAIDVYGNTSTPSLRFVDNVAAAARMAIDGSGNVGIGTASPSRKISIGGTATIGLGFEYTPSDQEVAGTFVNTDTGEVKMYGNTNYYYTFYTNNTERMRIDSSGTVFMGQTSNPATGTLVLKVPTGTGNGCNAQLTSNTGTSYPWANYNATGTYVGGMTATSSATGFSTSSDVRLKKNIEDAPSAINKVLTAQVVSHDWINNDVHVEYGFIAQDLQKIIPQAVVEGTDKEDGTIDIPWGVDYSKIVPLLTKAIQELTERVKALENKQ